MLDLDKGLVFANIYRHPCEEVEITSGPFHAKDLDICGIVNFFVPFVILQKNQCS